MFAVNPIQLDMGIQNNVLTLTYFLEYFILKRQKDRKTERQKKTKKDKKRRERKEKQIKKKLTTLGSLRYSCTRL